MSRLAPCVLRGDRIERPTCSLPQRLPEDWRLAVNLREDLGRSPKTSAQAKCRELLFPMLGEYGQEQGPVSLGRPDVREAVTRMQDLASYLSVLNAVAAR